MTLWTTVSCPRSNISGEKLRVKPPVADTVHMFDSSVTVNTTFSKNYKKNIQDNQTAARVTWLELRHFKHRDAFNTTAYGAKLRQLSANKESEHMHSVYEKRNNMMLSK